MSHDPMNRIARAWAVCNGLVSSVFAGVGGIIAVVTLAALVLKPDLDPPDVAAGMLGVGLLLYAVASGALTAGQAWVYRRHRGGGRPTAAMYVVLGLGALPGIAAVVWFAFIFASM